MNGSMLSCDVAVIGGGLAGSALAHALAHTPLSVVLVEARDPRRLEQPSFDDRATALARGSQRILTSLDVWGAVRDAAMPIDSIHISERGRFGASRIRAAEEGVPALGYLLENRVLGAAIWDALAGAPRFACVAPAALESLTPGAEEVTLRVAASGRALEIRARLAVAADGAGSRVRNALGIAATTDDYGQRAVILNCRTEEPHAGRAFERFTTDGPVAMLPLTGNRVAAVWTLPLAAAERAMALGDAQFARELQQAFGFRLGRFVELGRRRAYPLLRTRSAALVAPRTVLVGSAAVNLHPVAGQGFNLALRDVAALAEVLCDAVAESAENADAGAPRVLERYRAWRRGDQARVAAFTHGLVKFFGCDSRPVAISRGLGLMLFDLLPGAKHGLVRHTMGLAGRLSRPARGLPLMPRPSGS